ncbi:3'-5' exonuclease [Phormidium sp. CLA17]|uniref:3'-5' exonuclease n=1 Tax=Leptolyngbya sp. Cla-17 TaxID=2803751 RepID=UPI001490D689|nr:3'-5' exonuclease [Leptolyngbya sp. Cla-17]MBM0744305.1 3'-5' exonuclease [Leptolyngbya sp. Cla-17]
MPPLEVSEDTEVIEIAILDGEGTILLEELVKSIGIIEEGARAVHGITDDELASAPGWPEVAQKVSLLIEGRLVVCHNADFELRMLRQSYTRHGLPMPQS